VRLSTLELVRDSLQQLPEARSIRRFAEELRIDRTATIEEAPELEEAQP
jgi:hypothetical protein